MRKIGQIFKFLIPVIALVALVVFMTGAGRRRRAKVEEMTALAEREFEGWDTGNVDLFDEVYAPDFVKHSPGAPYGDQDVEALKQHVLSMHKAQPGCHLTMDEQIIGHEFDRAARRWTWRWTNPDTGKEVIMTGCTVAYLGANGKVVEERDYGDWLGLFQQLGFKLVPPEE